MSASDEWREYHLTTRGWIPGSHKHDFGPTVHVARPADAVMTWCYREQQGSMHSKVHRSCDEVWRSEDGASIDRLLAQYGPCPEAP